MKKAADMIRECMEEKDLPQRQLAVRMGEDVRYLNQQLNRQKDMKVERFADVLDHIGYRIEIIENDGIQKVSPEFAMQIINNREPAGLFWYFCNGKYIGVDNYNSEAEAYTEKFDTKEECLDWLRGVR